jgi:hypothetical protein
LRRLKPADQGLLFGETPGRRASSRASIEMKKRGRRLIGDRAKAVR